jgi:hypothetical protein
MRYAVLFAFVLVAGCVSSPPNESAAQQTARLREAAARRQAFWDFNDHLLDWVDHQDEPADRHAAKLREDLPFQKALCALNDNPLVQKAMKDHDVVVAQIEAEYRRDLAVARGEAASEMEIEAVLVVREKKLDTAKTACLAALRHAEGVSKSLYKTEEAAAIAAMADRMETSFDNQRFTTAQQLNPQLMP